MVGLLIQVQCLKRYLWRLLSVKARTFNERLILMFFNNWLVEAYSIKYLLALKLLGETEILSQLRCRFHVLQHQMFVLAVVINLTVSHVMLGWREGQLERHLLSTHESGMSSSLNGRMNGLRRQDATGHYNGTVHRIWVRQRDLRSETILGQEIPLLLSCLLHSVMIMRSSLLLLL